MIHPTPTSAVAAALDALSEEFWEAYLEAHPGFATVLGDRRFDDRLDDLSRAAQSAWSAFLEQTIERATALDQEQLDDRAQITRLALIGEARGQLEALATGVDDWSVNPIDGLQTWIVDLVEYQPIRTPTEGGRLVTRVRGVNRLVDQLVERLRDGLARGCVASVVPLEAVLDEVRLLAATPATSWRLATPAKEPHADWNAVDLATFRADLINTIETVVIPAFDRYANVLEQEILPVARPSDQPGLVHVPDGAAAYRALARFHTSLDLDPRAIHEIGMVEIERLDLAIADLGAEVLGVHGLEATLHALRHDPTLRFETAEEVLEKAQRTLERAQAAIPMWFGRLPHAPCEVVP
ncbi:MAG: DUF885 family protein, partial [Chloroflexota bacterium]